MTFPFEKIPLPTTNIKILRTKHYRHTFDYTKNTITSKKIKIKPKKKLTTLAKLRDILAIFTQNYRLKKALKDTAIVQKTIQDPDLPRSRPFYTPKLLDPDQ